MAAQVVQAVVVQAGPEAAASAGLAPVVLAGRAPAGGLGGVATQGGASGAAAGANGAAGTLGNGGSIGGPDNGGGQTGAARERLRIPGGRHGFNGNRNRNRDYGSGFGYNGGAYGQGSYRPYHQSRCLVRVRTPYGHRLRRVC